MHLSLPAGTPQLWPSAWRPGAAALRGHSMSELEGFATQAPEAFVANPRPQRPLGASWPSGVGVAAAGKGWLLRDMVVDVVSLPLWPVGWVPLGPCPLTMPGIRKETLGVAWPPKAELGVFGGGQENGLAFCT